MKTKQTVWIVFLLLAITAFSFVPFLPRVISAQAERKETPSSTNVQLVQKADDTVRNPYAPPVRHPSNDQYAQIGYLQSGSEKIILFAKPCPTQRRKWLYYTVVNGIKLSVEVGKHVCTVSPGCDELANRDTVTVDSRPYKVQLYESDMYEYDPFRM
jgi:hypothetical protein